jgi:hypothetical protein
MKSGFGDGSADGLVDAGAGPSATEPTMSKPGLTMSTSASATAAAAASSAAATIAMRRAGRGSGSS